MKLNFLVGMPHFFVSNMWFQPFHQDIPVQLPILPLVKQEAPILINPITKKICVEAQLECWRTTLSTEEATRLKRAYLIGGEA